MTKTISYQQFCPSCRVWHRSAPRSVCRSVPACRAAAAPSLSPSDSPLEAPLLSLPNRTCSAPDSTPEHVIMILSWLASIFENKGLIWEAQTLKSCKIGWGMRGKLFFLILFRRIEVFNFLNETNNILNHQEQEEKKSFIFTIIVCKLTKSLLLFCSKEISISSSLIFLWHFSSSFSSWRGSRCWNCTVRNYWFFRDFERSSTWSIRSRAYLWRSVIDAGGKGKCRCRGGEGRGTVEHGVGQLLLREVLALKSGRDGPPSVLPTHSSTTLRSLLRRGALRRGILAVVHSHTEGKAWKFYNLKKKSRRKATNEVEKKTLRKELPWNFENKLVWAVSFQTIAKTG